MTNILEPEGPAEAVIRRVGRFLWSAEVHHGVFVYQKDAGGNLVLGRKRAERAARKLLTKYLRNRGYEATQYIVGQEGNF